MENIMNNENIVEVQDVATTTDIGVESVDVITEEAISTKSVFSGINWKHVLAFGGGYVVGKYGGKVLRWVGGKLVKACLPIKTSPVIDHVDQQSAKTVAKEAAQTEILDNQETQQSTQPDTVKTTPVVEPEVVDEEVNATDTAQQESTK